MKQIINIFSKYFKISLLISVILLCSSLIILCSEKSDKNKDENKIKDNNQNSHNTDKKNQKENKKISVAVSIAPYKTFVNKITSDKVDVIVMLPSNANPKTYSPKPSQLKALKEASLYFKVGYSYHFEKNWMEKIQSNNKDMLIIDTSDGISKLEDDPHIWMSPGATMTIVNNMLEALTKVDPSNKDFYSKNASAFIRELADIDNEIRKELALYENRKFVVFHPFLGYYARDYGITQLSIENEGHEPSAHDLTSIVRIAKDNKISKIFVQPQFNTKSAGVIAKEISGSLIEMDPFAEDYIKNLKLITEDLISDLKNAPRR